MLGKEERFYLKMVIGYVFVGNSITFKGEFHHNISLYCTLHFLNTKVNFFNCGISGDRTDCILKRMDKDILIHYPTYVVIYDRYE